PRSGDDARSAALRAQDRDGRRYAPAGERTAGCASTVRRVRPGSVGSDACGAPCDTGARSAANPDAAGISSPRGRTPGRSAAMSRAPGALQPWRWLGVPMLQALFWTIVFGAPLRIFGLQLPEP